MSSIPGLGRSHARETLRGSPVIPRWGPCPLQHLKILQHWLTLSPSRGCIHSADFNIPCDSQNRSYKKATSKELWYNWKHFPFNIYNSFMHLVNKWAFYIWYCKAYKLMEDSQSLHNSIIIIMSARKMLRIHQKGSVI